MEIYSKLSRIASLLPTLCVIVFSINSSEAKGKSVYAIPQHWGNAKLNVYDIMEDSHEGQLEYRASYNLKYAGAGDVTIDTTSNTLFVTFENRRVIELIDARTFLSQQTVEAPSASNLAGIVVDQIDPNTTRVYTVDRGTNKLFVYDWDASDKSLTLVPPDPNMGNDYVELQSADPNFVTSVWAGGLAFDTQTKTLYVSQFLGSGSSLYYTPYVHAFDRDNNWEPARLIDLGEHNGEENYAVDIDVDADNGFLYAGGYNYADNSHNNLIRFDLEQEDPNATDYGGHVQDIGAGVIGLAVSPGTRFVYMTTYNNLLEAWDTNRPLVGGWDQINAESIAPGRVCVLPMLITFPPSV